MPMISITLNGQKIEAREGQTILEVAREHGIRIPT
ncbi:MAG: bidirectional hydrogenase complex protein HoxU, partial [Anaerolineae bacterium]